MHLEDRSTEQSPPDGRPQDGEPHRDLAHRTAGSPSFDPAVLDDLSLAPHHTESIANVVADFAADPECLALVLGGSLAHGFASPSSDIDVTIVVDAPVYERRAADGRLHYTDLAACTYAGGYVDGKYVDLELLRRVAVDGSDPARYAFADARILLSDVPDLAELLASIVRYPVDAKADRIERFAAQLLAWRWYHGEAVQKRSAYLEVLALQKVVLFACRIVLAANEMLFPFHKWMLRVTEAAPDRPADLMTRIDQLLARPSWDRTDGLCRAVFDHYRIDTDRIDDRWPTLFMEDTELAWMTRRPPIDDC